MMHLLAFAPLIPLTALWVLMAFMALFCAWGFFRHARGAVWRLISALVLLLVIANPAFVHEKRAPLADVAVIVMDRSPSMQLGARLPDADAALKKLKAKLAGYSNLEVRTVTVRGDGPGGNSGTQAFTALDAALADVAPSRFAGAIFITDGEVHDAPAQKALGRYSAPVNALIIGEHNETDRKLTIVDAARYAMVGKSAQIMVRVDDLGGSNRGSAQINLRVDGKDAKSLNVPLGKPTAVDIPVTHEGESVVELEAAPGPRELTLQNNRAVATITGVRDRLRVLLVSGEPNAGERVWRTLLKTDPSVDLVHFTILRPPLKQLQDMTPMNELSLIVFPTRELFAEKLDGFDLVIFDRFSARHILPMAYFANIADYVQNGGALLISAGPEFADQETSIYRTPLAMVLPVRPSGRVLDGSFLPRLTDTGRAHPVTAGLAGAGDENHTPSWGPWFREIGGEKLSGETVMEGPGHTPLLVLDRVGKGRVAELMSDQGWLWARGYQGGGPQAELLRRTAHWLMKEPQLEEERLTADISGNDLVITRRTLATRPPVVTVTDPAGGKQVMELSPVSDGLWKGRVPADSLGLYHVTDGTLSAVAAAGPLNPQEVSDMRATGVHMAPAAAATGGAVKWYADGMPGIDRPDKGESTGGQDFALTRNHATQVTSVDQIPLLPPWWGLVLVLGTLCLTWWREGR